MQMMRRTGTVRFPNRSEASTKYFMLTNYSYYSSAEDKKKKKKKKKKPKKKTTAGGSAEIKDDIMQEYITSTTSPTTPFTAKSYGGSAKSPGGAKSMDPYLVGKDTEPKVKVKTQVDPGTVNKDGDGTTKKGFFSKFTGKKDKEKVEGAKDEVANGGGGGVFGKRGALQLPARAGALMGRLLGSKDDEAMGKAPMRWDNFVKVLIAQFSAILGSFVEIGDEPAWIQGR
jgi:hypothetical protein